jgi:hypothetical protein
LNCLSMSRVRYPASSCHWRRRSWSGENTRTWSK